MSNSKHRAIRKRWVVEGTLLLETPAHFGNGDADALTDMPLLFDEVTNAPLLPGTSIAGALRNYLRERENDFGKDFPTKDDQKNIEHERDLLATRLFGGYRGDDDGEQSPLIVHDAIGKSTGIELRDGVKIDGSTRSAEDKKKYDIQLLAAGTTFDLRFELLIGGDASEEKLKQALATALLGLTNREITLGARKRRGFGQCTVKEWHERVYDLMDPAGLKAWLASETAWADQYPLPPQPDIDLAMLALKTDQRDMAHLTATFSIDGTLLIRSGFGESDAGPDTVHLHARHKDLDTPVPVIPGTSWAGILRHRALKIARTVSVDRQATDQQGIPLTKKVEDEELPVLKAEVFVDGMFGPSEVKRGNKATKASRIAIRESVIEHSSSLVQTRVKIDRFTGGAYEGALFSEQPVVGSPQTSLVLDLTLQKPARAELGLLLFLLRDLWTGDLPVGGESGIGRGRLRGMSATLEAYGHSWNFNTTDDENGVVISTSEGAVSAQDLVDEFNKVEKWTA
jgi:CRISPR/Cas system CSM-associated protein Csm3 (group 7 of RAMP superfamily)